MMARIRTIKPEFPQSESMGRVSRDARLLFVELWTICDDHGRARAHSRMLASLLFPYDDDAGSLMSGWLKELEDEGCIRIYEVNGSQYLQVVGWSKHQKIDRPSNPQFPPPDGEPSRGLASIRESSSLEGIKDQGREGKGEEQERAPASPAPAVHDKPKPRPVAVTKPYGVSDQAWSDFLTLRKSKRAPLTATALAGLAHEADKAGLSLQSAIELCCERGWQSLKAEWLAGGSLRQAPAAQASASPASATPHRKRLGEGSSTDYGIPGIGTPYAARAAS